MSPLVALGVMGAVAIFAFGLLMLSLWMLVVSENGGVV